MNFALNGDKIKVFPQPESEPLVFKSSPVSPNLYTGPAGRVVIQELASYADVVGMGKHTKLSRMREPGDWVGLVVAQSAAAYDRPVDYWVLKTWIGEDELQFGCTVVRKPLDTEWPILEGAFDTQPWVWDSTDYFFREVTRDLQPLQIKLVDVLGMKWVVGRLASQTLFAARWWEVLAKPEKRVEVCGVDYAVDIRHKTIHAHRPAKKGRDPRRAWAVPAIVLNKDKVRKLNGLPKPAPKLKLINLADL